MVGCTKRPTKAQGMRMARIALMRCVACYLSKRHGSGGRTEVHHLLSGNKRLGHDATVPLCVWHHRGEPVELHTRQEMRHEFGPSLALQSKAFHLEYGSDAELLRVTNQLLEDLPRNQAILFKEGAL